MKRLSKVRLYGKLTWQKIGFLPVLLILCLILSILRPQFLSYINLTNLVRQICVIAILAAGMTFVILAGGIDLSIGSVAAFSGLILASFMINYSMWLGIFLCLVAGLSLGLVNGLVISVGNVSPFVATLGMMGIARSFALIYTGGRPLFGFPKEFGYIASGNVGPFPVPLIIVVCLYAFSYFVLRTTKFGLYIYALGGNEEATRLTGINTRKYKTMSYLICGGATGLGAIVLTSRLYSAQPYAGVGFELDAIAAVVVGGTSLFGGRGGVIGTLIGAVLIGVIRNGLNLLDVNPLWHQAAVGTTIIVAAVVDIALTRTSG